MPDPSPSSSLDALTKAFLAQDFADVGISLAKAKAMGGSGLVAAQVSQLWKLACAHPFSDTQTGVLAQFYPIAKATSFWHQVMEQEWYDLYRHNPNLFKTATLSRQSRYNVFPGACALMAFAQNPSELQLLATLQNNCDRAASDSSARRKYRTLFLVQSISHNNELTTQWILNNAGATWDNFAEGLCLAYSLRAHPERLTPVVDQVAKLLQHCSNIDWDTIASWLDPNGLQLLKARVEKQKLGNLLPVGDLLPESTTTKVNHKL